MLHICPLFRSLPHSLAALSWKISYLYGDQSAKCREYSLVAKLLWVDIHVVVIDINPSTKIFDSADWVNIDLKFGRSGIFEENASQIPKGGSIFGGWRSHDEATTRCNGVNSAPCPIRWRVHVRRYKHVLVPKVWGAQFPRFMQ